MNELIAIAVIAFTAGVVFTILFARWLLWNDVLIETAAHTVDDDEPDEDDDWTIDNYLMRNEASE